MLALGVAPVLLVSEYYHVLPQRLVIHWDTFGRLTVIATRAASVLTVAYVAAATALVAVVVGAWQHTTLVTLDLRRAFLGLNLAQLVAINLTCLMLVTDALGLALTLKPMIPPAMAVLLFAGAVLCWRLADHAGSGLLRLAALALGVASLALVGSSALVANAFVGYYASAFAVLAMIALALPASYAASA
jgi:hypothetical protein